MKDLLQDMLELIKVNTHESPLGGYPSGQLYALVMGGMSHETYEHVIQSWIAAGLIERTNSHLLRYIG